MFLSPRVSKPTYPATIIDRPRLYGQLDRWPELRAIVIHTPTGYGKSSLVSRWIDHAGLDGCAAWLSLDEGDGDPRRFALHLAAALDRVVPGALELAQPILKDSEGSTQRVLMRLFSALWEEVGTGSLTGDQQTLLVLDDLHRVQSAEVDAAIRLILEVGPPQLHVLLLTRQRTTLPLARLYAHEKIAVLDAKELEFTAGEVQEYLARHGFAQPSEAELAQLVTRSEGWVTALQMAILALRGRGSVAQLIEHLHGSREWLADYLGDEVLDLQTPALRRFLLQTSILDEFNAQLCAAVTGDGDAYARLDEIARADLFLIQLDAGKRWFRYHHLFQELLKHRLQAQAGAGVVAELHRRAAAWLANAGEIPTAVRHLLAAGEQDQAAALVESQIGATLLRAPVQARGLLALIPHEVLVQRPQLMLDRCRLGEFFDDKDILTYAEEAARTLQERQSSDPDAARHYAELLVFRSAAYHTHRNVSAATADFHQAQAHVAYLDEFHRGMLRFVEMTLHGYAGRMAEMEQAAEAVLEAFERTGFDLGNVALRRELAKWSMRAGNSGQATRRFEELFQDRSWDPLNVARELVLSYFPATENSYWQNHLAQAQSYQRSALELAVQLQDTDLIQAARCLGRILGEDGQDDRVSVLDFSDRLRRVITPGVADLLLDCQTRFLIATGRSDLAWQIVQESGANLQNLPKNHVHRRMITCLRTHIARGVDLEAITPALAEALAIAMEHNHRFDQLQLLALAAWQQLQLGGPEAALETLQQAVQLAQETGYVRVLLDIPALAPADWSDDEALAASLGEVKDLLTKREHDVLALLAEDLTYAQIGEELVISLSTVRAHVNRIYKKLAVHRRDQAIQRARELGLLRPSPSDFT